MKELKTKVLVDIVATFDERKTTETEAIGTAIRMSVQPNYESVVEGVSLYRASAWVATNDMKELLAEIDNFLDEYQAQQDEWEVEDNITYLNEAITLLNKAMKVLK